MIYVVGTHARYRHYCTARGIDHSFRSADARHVRSRVSACVLTPKQGDSIVMLDAYATDTLRAAARELEYRFLRAGVQKRYPAKGVSPTP